MKVTQLIDLIVGLLPLMILPSLVITLFLYIKQKPTWLKILLTPLFIISIVILLYVLVWMVVFIVVASGDGACYHQFD